MKHKKSVYPNWIYADFALNIMISSFFIFPAQIATEETSTSHRFLKKF